MEGLPVCIFTVLFILILSGYVLVALAKAILFQTMTFLVVYLDITAFPMVLLTAASGINVKTAGWIQKVKGRSNSAYWTRVHRSLRVLRLEFGKNFEDKLTMVIQEFCMRQTASLLLLSSK